MRVTTGAFAAAINYLATFAGRGSPILFSPHGNLVAVSVFGPIAYGEYWMKTVEPLKERFALSSDRLPFIAKEVDDELMGTIRYEQQSIAMFESNGRKWWIPFMDPQSVIRPEIKEQKQDTGDKNRFRRLTWNESFLSAVNLMESAVGDSENRWQDIQVSRRNGVRWMASTNGDVFALSKKREKSEEGNMQVLIHRRFIPHLKAVAHSNGSVAIWEGLRLLRLECGSRKAIIVHSDAEFPAWDKVFAEDECSIPGQVTVSKADLLRAARQMKLISSSMVLRSSGSLIDIYAKNSLGECDDTKIQAENRIGEFSQFEVSTQYMVNVLSAWPDDQVTIETKNANTPVKFRSGSTTSIIGTMQRSGENEKKETREPELAGFS